LAQWNVEHRDKPDAARRLYQFILDERPGSADSDYALVETAELQARSDDPEQRTEALEKFRQVLREAPDEELKELSVLGIARLLMDEEKFAEAQPHWEQYLENREWTVSRPEANYGKRPKIRPVVERGPTG